MGSADQPTRLNNIFQPGDELYYEPLFIRFLIDENMKNYYQVHDWIRRIYTPVSSQEFTYNTQDDAADDRRPYAPRDKMNLPIWGDNGGDLIVHCLFYQVIINQLSFIRDCFSISLTTLNFDSSVSDVNYFTAGVFI